MIARKLVKKWDNLSDSVSASYKKATFRFYFNKIVNYGKQ